MSKRPPLDEHTALLSLVNMLARPSINLYEGWQDEAGIDNTVWTVADPATGVAWTRGPADGYLRAFSTPAANETCRLRSNQAWPFMPDTYGANTILRKSILEFELKLTNVANIDNTLAFFGLSGVLSDRQSQDLIGWALLADALQSLTDDGGAETVNTGFGETLTNWNKLKIEACAGHVKFYLNEVLVADHTTNLPDDPLYVNFFVDTEAGGFAMIEVGIIRCWFEDIP